ncbi:MAG: hypothetical protein KL787_00825 [Taibaiella sp.]|nr:hypothetical protein [Taibaiella sp.]
MRKALYFFSLIIVVAVSSFAREGYEERDDLCETFKKDAQSGISSGKIVFKRFGMPVDLLSEETRDYLIKKYNLHIRQMGCIIVPGEQCYNEEIDAYFVKAHGKHVYELIEEAQKATGQK